MRAEWDRTGATLRAMTILFHEQNANQRFDGPPRAQRHTHDFEPRDFSCFQCLTSDERSPEPLCQPALIEFRISVASSH
jgi:hypothetical protein